MNSCTLRLARKVSSDFSDQRTNGDIALVNKQYAEKYGRSQRRLAVHRRVRRKVKGSSDRPRMAVFRSLRHFYVQLVDDVMGVTLASASTLKAGSRIRENNRL